MCDSITTSRKIDEAEVWLLDDDHCVLEYLAHFLHLHHIPSRIFEHSAAVLAADGLPPACLLVDFHLGDQNGLQVAQQCHKQWPFTSIILMSGQATIPLTVTAMRQAIEGVLEKPIGEAKLMAEVHNGLALFRARSDSHDEQTSAHHKIQNLSMLELEILKLLVKGLPNKQIASDRAIALRTVEKHRNALFKKLDVESAAEASRIWVLANLSPSRQYELTSVVS